VYFALLAAVIAGTLIAFQSALIGVFGSQVHPFVAATWVHGAGLVFGVVGSRLGFQLETVRQAPLGLLAGVAGMLLVTAIAVAVGGAGLATTLAIVTAVQLLVGFVLEATGFLGRAVAVDPVRIAGAVLIVLGVVLVASRSPSGVT
jgi:bacterial/archaeal transporter family-2 protein